MQTTAVIIKNNDGFHLALVLDEPSAIFLDYFPPPSRLVGLAAYNNGMLHGVWIDASLDVDDIKEQINKMLASGPEVDAEEWAIHGFEDFGPYRLSEYEGIQSVHDVACFIGEHGEVGAELIGVLGDLEQGENTMEESYVGCHKSVADFAEELTEDGVQIPQGSDFDGYWYS